MTGTRDRGVGRKGKWLVGGSGGMAGVARDGFYSLGALVCPGCQPLGHACPLRPATGGGSPLRSSDRSCSLGAVQWSGSEQGSPIPSCLGSEVRSTHLGGVAPISSLPGASVCPFAKWGVKQTLALGAVVKSIWG